MSPRVLFEMELEELKGKVAQMGEQAQISYHKMISAIKRNDEQSLTLLLDNDHKMSEMQRAIEGMCLSLITKQQPVAKDMRLVSASLKVVTDLERIGDHVVDIAELYLRMGHLQDGKNETLLLAMMDEAKDMLNRAVDVFGDADIEIADRIIDMDDSVDDKFNQVKEDLMDAIRNQSLDPDKVVDYLLVAKYLEKIADHAVNICEWAKFQVTGDFQGTQIY